jgi:hypothetical protein
VDDAVTINASVSVTERVPRERGEAEMIDRQTSLEGQLSRTQADADEALRALANVARELRRLKKAATSGSVRELRGALQAAQERASALAEAVGRVRDGWQLDEREYLESGGYKAELLAAAAERGLRLYEQDERIIGYPSVIRILAADCAIDIDRKRERRLRPSLIASYLRDLQTRPPRFPAERFLEALFRAYKLVLAERGRPHGATVSLLRVYQVLTLLPGQSRDYAKQEFVRDVYLLDASGVKETSDGYRVRFPASSGTRTSATLSTVTKTGELKVYYGIAFDGP